MLGEGEGAYHSCGLGCVSCASFFIFLFCNLELVRVCMWGRGEGGICPRVTLGLPNTSNYVYTELIFA